MFLVKNWHLINLVTTVVVIGHEKTSIKWTSPNAGPNSDKLSLL